MSRMKKVCRGVGTRHHHEEWMDISMFSTFSEMFWGILCKVPGRTTDLFRNTINGFWLASGDALKFGRIPDSGGS